MSGSKAVNSIGSAIYGNVRVGALELSQRIGNRNSAGIGGRNMNINGFARIEASVSISGGVRNNHSADSKLRSMNNDVEIAYPGTVAIGSRNGKRNACTVGYAVGGGDGKRIVYCNGIAYREITKMFGTIADLNKRRT